MPSVRPAIVRTLQDRLDRAVGYDLVGFWVTLVRIGAIVL